MATYIPSDPLFHVQWHLLNQGNTPGSVAGHDINVIRVWPDYSGKGVIVGILDQGTDFSHPDLAANYRQDLSWDMALNVPGGEVRHSGDLHGVPVAGLVSAVAGNGVGGVGVAWGSEFAMYRAPFRGEGGDTPHATYKLAAEKIIESGVDIMVNSWGIIVPFGFDSEDWTHFNNVTQSMAEHGRSGLGVATLFAAGNTAHVGFSSDEDPTADNPWVIVVGAGAQDGSMAFYSTPGASVLVTAPGSFPRSMVSTDRQGYEGYNCMVSTIMHQPPLYDPEKHHARYELPTELEYTFSTVRHWGENLAGDWVLRVIADSQGSPVTLNDWSIEAYTAGSGGGTQIFTDEYSWFVGIEPERTDIDAANGDTLNAAAVPEDVRFDLATGTGAIGATALTLIDAESMRHLISGDGNDVLIGNDAENILLGGRGTNHIDGGAGLDAARLIEHFGEHQVEAVDGALVVRKQGLAAGGVDVLSNVELLVFADQVVLVNKPAGLGADLFDESAYLAQNPDVAAAVDQGEVASGRVHYDGWGAAEGRNPNDLFSEHWYLNTYADVASAVETGALASGFQHYREFGWAEGRDPSAWMDTSAYLAANTDVVAAHIDPLQHFLLYGVHEGRTITALDVADWV